SGDLRQSDWLRRGNAYSLLVSRHHVATHQIRCGAIGSKPTSNSGSASPNDLAIVTSSVPVPCFGNIREDPTLEIWLFLRFPPIGQLCRRLASCSLRNVFSYCPRLGIRTVIPLTRLCQLIWPILSTSDQRIIPGYSGGIDLRLGSILIVSIDNRLLIL